MTNDGVVRVKRTDAVYKRMRDPQVISRYYKTKMVSIADKHSLSGSSPTDLFVGRYGYPKVFVGPVVPPEFGNTSIFSSPELWRSKSIEEIVGMRLRLVRGIFTANIRDVEKGKMMENIRDLALAESPVDSDMGISGKINIKSDVRDHVEPFGPSVKLSGFDMGNAHADKRIESRYSDRDATSTTSLIELYDKGVPVSKLSKGLSAGIFGIGKNRKMVPTRWSITAVDDTISKNKREKIKGYDPIDHIEMYYHVALDTRWMVFFIPGEWNYEAVEAWYPHTTWNDNPREISISSSSEGYKGRSTYAEITGSYYAARLAVTERLEKMKRQARILILREIHDGYNMPVGVWNVREHVRETLGKPPITVEDINGILGNVALKLDVTPKEWIRNSTILKSIFLQKGIMEYM